MFFIIIFSTLYFKIPQIFIFSSVFFQKICNKARKLSTNLPETRLSGNKKRRSVLRNAVWLFCAFGYADELHHAAHAAHSTHAACGHCGLFLFLGVGDDALGGEQKSGDAGCILES